MLSAISGTIGIELKHDLIDQSKGIYMVLLMIIALCENVKFKL